MSADTLFDADLQVSAHARCSMPETSHIAAQRQTLVRMGLVHDRIVALLRDLGPLTDEQLHAAYVRSFGRISVSGCRTRRKEATDQKRVTQHGVDGKTSSGGRCCTWQATQPTQGDTT